MELATKALILIVFLLGMVYLSLMMEMKEIHDEIRALKEGKNRKKP